MVNIRLLVILAGLVLSTSMMVNYINNIKPVWEGLIKQQAAINSESKRYSDKLRSLEQTVMAQWESAYENVGDSDRVSLSKQLNVKGTSLIPTRDVPNITKNESIVSTIGGAQVPLGLRKVCFGQGYAGYEARGHSIGSVVSAMRDIEQRAGTDFDQYTVTSIENGIKVNFYDLCVYLKEAGKS